MLCSLIFDKCRISHLFKITASVIGLIALFAVQVSAVSPCSLSRFTPAFNYSAPGLSPYGVATGDLNDDGRFDLAVLNITFNGGVAVFLNDGTGSFGAGTMFPTGFNSYDVAIGDFNNDSHLDLAVVNINSANVSVLLWNRYREFQSRN